MRREYRYRFGRRTLRSTMIIAAVTAMVVVLLLLRSNSGYFPVWFLSFLGILLILSVLSIPRKIVLDDDRLEIRCIVDMTSIPLRDIVAVHKVDPREMRWCLPIFGSFGFFGYYGYYFSLKEWTLFRIYASRWSGFVRIDDMYENTYLFNCDDAEELIFLIRRARDEKLAENLGE